MDKIDSLQSNKGVGTLATLHTTGWNILNEEVSLPVAVLSESALTNNTKWMQKFSENAGVKLAPHGKTTMAPELFKRQIEQGCWGMSLATIPQVISAYQHGIKRFILANQLVGKFHCEQLAKILRDTDVEFYCFVDSYENLRFLGEFFASENVTVNVLIEIGVEGGRCGWRDFSTVSEFAKDISRYTALSLSGISFYEGVIYGDDAEEKINEFIQNIKQTFIELNNQNLFQSEDVILTGAGSAWYDVVAAQLTLDESLVFTPIIRPGCYLIHDTGIYQDAQNTVMQRSQIACDIGGDLSSSLTLWAYVYSVPEPGLVIVGLGKRDAAFDAGLPIPELHFRPGNDKPTIVESSWKSVKIMDQHLMLETDKTADIKPGDMICFSTSHPCLTFDKWRQIGIADDNFVINKQVATYF